MQKSGLPCTNLNNFENRASCHFRHNILFNIYNIYKPFNFTLHHVLMCKFLFSNFIYQVKIWVVQHLSTFIGKMCLNLMTRKHIIQKNLSLHRPVTFWLIAFASLHLPANSCFVYFLCKKVQFEFMAAKNIGSRNSGPGQEKGDRSTC